MTGGPAQLRPVLVVDDDAVVRRVVRAVLETDGYRVTEAATGADAVAAVAAHAPAAVVLDLLLPDLDGVEVCRALGAASPVVVLTARDDPDLAARCRAAGAAAFLVKPFGSEELLRLVGGLVAVD